MPFVINPDGTVDMIDVEYDSYGNMRPKIKREPSMPSFKPSEGIGSFYSKKKRKKNKNKDVVTKTAASQQVSGSVVNKPSQNKEEKSIVKKVRIITRQSVERFFIRKKSLRQLVSNEELMRAKVLLKGLLLDLFMQRYEQYKKYCTLMGWGIKIPAINKRKQKKNKKKKKHIFENVERRNNASGHTIADTAKFSSINDSMADTDVVYNRTGPSRPPKYGYARDYFGRVQERDSFNEEKNEFKRAERNQSHYDYSSFDAEDDHDSYYDSNGYE